MKHKSVILVLMFVASGVMLVGCGAQDSTPASTAPPQQVQAPAPAVTSADICVVPDVVGLTEAAANGLLAELGLKPAKNIQYDSTIAEGFIISQDPIAGTTKEPCQGVVTIVVSKGPMPSPPDTPAPTNTRNRQIHLFYPHARQLPILDCSGIILRKEFGRNC